MSICYRPRVQFTKYLTKYLTVYHEIILSLSQDQLKTSSYDSDLQRAKISVRNIVSYNLQTLSQTILVFASESYQENSCVLRKIVFF